jgi:hypothetical protein
MSAGTACHRRSGATPPHRAARLTASWRRGGERGRSTGGDYAVTPVTVSTIARDRPLFVP